MRRMLLRAMTACLMAGPVAAQEPAAQDALLRAIAPFVDEMAFVVGHVDPGAFDAQAFWDGMGSLVGAEFVEGGRDEFIQRVAALRAAECTDICVILSIGSPAPFEPLVVYVFADDAAAAAGAEEVHGEQVGRCVLQGRREVVAWARGLEPPERPELAAALGAVAGSTARAAFIVPAHMEKVVTDTMPVLPDEIGGGPSSVLTRGVRWAAVGIDSWPALSLRLVVQSADAQAAQALAPLLERVVGKVAKMEPVLDEVPGLPKAAAAFGPVAMGDKVTFAIEGKALEDVLKHLLPRGLLRAAEAARAGEDVPTLPDQ